MSLSERIRPGSEAAQWVVDEVVKMEAEIALLKNLCGQAADIIEASRHGYDLNENEIVFRNKIQDLLEEKANVRTEGTTVSNG